MELNERRSQDQSARFKKASDSFFGNDELQLDRLRRSWGDCVAQSMSGDFESQSRRSVHRIKGAICPVTATYFFFLAFNSRRFRHRD